MSDIKNWSNLASGNISAPPDGAPENTTRFSDMNDIVREMMAAIRRQHENAQWIDLGHTVSFASVASFKVTGSDVRSIYSDGRRVLTYNGTGTIYGDVLSTTFAAGDTTITLANATGSLDSSLTSAAVGLLTPTNGAAPAASTRQSLSALESQTISTSALTAQTATISAITANNMTVSALNAQKGTISALVADTITTSSIASQRGSISALVVDSLSTSALTLAGNSVSIRALPKGWVGFAGANASIGASFGNISSVSRSAAGIYRINFSPAFSGTTYIMNWGHMEVASNATGHYAKMISQTSALAKIKFNVNGAATDVDEIYLTFWGD